MDRIEDVLEFKGHTVHTVAPDTTVREAVEYMCANHIGSVVATRADQPVGILTERDVMTRVVLQRRDPAATLVEDAMTKKLICVRATTRLAHARAVMTEHHCRHLPVLDGAGRLVGLVSIGDLVREMNHEQVTEIRFLTEYIRGAYPG
jgi:CBS domain-containing protein